MTITKTWQVNDMQRELVDGFVNKVIYRVIGTDGTYQTRATGEVELERPKTLVPYKDLTEEIVIGWVKANLEANEEGTVAKIEKAIDENITLQKTPVHGTGKPWA